MHNTANDYDDGFGSMINDYSNVFHTVRGIYIYDANTLISRYMNGFYAPLNDLAPIEQMFFTAANQFQDDALFWEIIENSFTPDVTDKILVSCDTAYSMFKIDVWDAFLNQCLNEEVIARASFVAHLKRDSIYIAVGD